MANNFIPGSALLSLHWSLNGQNAMNMLGAQVPAGLTIGQGTADRLWTAIASAFTTSGLAPRLAASTSLNGIMIRDYRTANNVAYVGSGGTPNIGTGIGDALPRHVALVVSIRTARAGASYRGRVFLPGFSEAENGVTGAVSQAASTAATAFVQAIASALGTETMALAVLSRPSDERTIQIITNPGLPNEETKLKHYPARPGGVTVAGLVLTRNLTWDTQRRRNNGRGELASAIMQSLVGVSSRTVNQPVGA